LALGLAGGYAIGGSLVASLQSQLSTFQAQVNSLQQDKSRLQSEVSSLRSENSSLHLQLNQKSAQIRSLQVQVQNLTAEAQRLEDLIRKGAIWSPDGINDFVSIEGSKSAYLHLQGLVGIDVIDIIGVGIGRLEDNLVVIVTTKKPLPAKLVYDDLELAAQQGWPYYVLDIDVMADHDGNKFGTSDLIIDDFGWHQSITVGSDFHLATEMGDLSDIELARVGNSVWFIIPLDLGEWGENPTVMSVRVYAGYEATGVRVFDFVPDATGFGGPFIDYNLGTYTISQVTPVSHLGSLKVMDVYWAVGGNTVTSVKKGDAVEVHVVCFAESGSVSGTLLVKVRKDIAFAPDVDYATASFNVNLQAGSSQDYSFVFIPQEASKGSLRGYHIEVWFRGEKIWTMDDTYPPRLKAS